MRKKLEKKKKTTNKIPNEEQIRHISMAQI